MNCKLQILQILFPSSESLVRQGKDKNSILLIIVGFLLLIRQRLLRLLAIQGIFEQFDSFYLSIFSQSFSNAKIHSLALIFMFATYNTPTEFILEITAFIFSSLKLFSYISEDFKMLFGSKFFWLSFSIEEQRKLLLQFNKKFNEFFKISDFQSHLKRIFSDFNQIIKAKILIINKINLSSQKQATNIFTLSFTITHFQPSDRNIQLRFSKKAEALFSFRHKDFMNMASLSSHSKNLELKSIISSKNFDDDFLWQNLNDQDLQEYQLHLNSLSQAFEIWQEAESQQQILFLKPPEIFISHIESFRFKDLFFDFLEGQNHQIRYIGSSKVQQVQNQIIKLVVQIFFKIGQEQKATYPHLFTHIKQQFYKPNIFQKEALNESQKENYSILIDIFFNEAHLTAKYEDFIKFNPDFQEICIIVFKRISFEESKHSEQQQKKLKTKAFQMIQNFCSKFIIEMSYFGYDEPEIEIIALANQERFVFLSESDHLFLLTLQKFELLNVRRKSSHNISVHEKSLRKSSHNKNKKKNSWNELQGIAHFRNEEFHQKIRDCLVSEIIDSDETSNYESSILNSESKVHEVSDQSTPKFKNSSIAHIRKKSHKDSFGCVDFDNMVYKDLANPKRYADQKANRQKDNAKNHHLNTDVFKKKVLSERFETHELESLTYADDQESQIQFVPHFQTNQTNEKGRIAAAVLFGSNPSSPIHSQNISNFSQLVTKYESQQKSKMIQRMKGSNIEKASQFFGDEDQLPQTIPQFKHQSSLPGHGKFQRSHFPGSRVLASSQIIEFTGSFFKLQNSTHENDENPNFLIIPSTNSKFNSISEKDERQSCNLIVLPHKDVFMSFSKNDKQKFLIPDSHQIQQTENQSESLQKNELGTQQTLNQADDEINNAKIIKYSYRTQKEQRQKFRNRQKNEQDIEVSQTVNSFISQHTPNSFSKKPKYKRYLDMNTSQSIIFNQFDSASEINMKKSHTFENQVYQKNSFKLQRKHSSNIPVYKAVQTQENIKKSRPEVKINQNINNKRFQEHSVRFSQIFQNNEEEIFYIDSKDQNRESFGNRKQRKVTDFYESPLINLTKGGNRASQIIENVHNSDSNQNLEKKLENYFNLPQENSNSLINSGGGKNYSVISNISYDEEKRIQDLIQIENQRAIKNRPTLENKEFRNFSDQQIDFGNVQAIERLILKKKQQKIKLNSETLTVSIKPNVSNFSEPKDWIKKEVFYFFKPNPISAYRPPQKHVIINPQRSKLKVIKETVNMSKSKNKEFPNSSASLYNFSIQKKENPESEVQKDKSVSNKSLGDRKYSVNQMRPVSEMNLNTNFDQKSGFQMQKQNGFPYMSNHMPIQILEQPQKRPVKKSLDKVSIHTQPFPVSTIRISPPKKQQPVNAVIPAQSNLESSAQNIKTYPSQPIIRFTLRTNLQTPNIYVQPQSQINPFHKINSQQNIKTYRVG